MDWQAKPDISILLVSVDEISVNVTVDRRARKQSKTSAGFLGFRDHRPKDMVADYTAKALSYKDDIVVRRLSYPEAHKRRDSVTVCRRKFSLESFTKRTP